MAPSPSRTAIPAPVDLTDVDAWYEAHGRSVYSYVRFHLAAPDAAEDVTAETFLKACRNQHRFDPARGSVEAWLLAIAKNTLRDHQRRAKLRTFLPLSSFRDLVSELPSPEERLLWEEEVASLLDAIAGLREEDREIISLRYGSGLDSAAAGEVLGLSSAAVRTRLWRALQRLRRALAP